MNMNYEEWLKTAVVCSDIRIIDDLYDQYPSDEPIPGVVFANRVGHPDAEYHTVRFDITGHMYQYNGMWQVQIENTEREFIDFQAAAKYLWDTWVRYEYHLNWDRRVKWSTGEEVVILDGPHVDGGMELRAPIEFVKSQREATCTVNPDGTIAHPESLSYPRVVYA